MKKNLDSSKIEDYNLQLRQRNNLRKGTILSRTIKNPSFFLPLPELHVEKHHCWTASDFCARLTMIFETPPSQEGGSVVERRVNDYY